MKPYYLFSLLALCFISLSGCGKKDPPPPTAYEVSGVKVDMPKLQAAFAEAPPEISTDVNQTSAALRYGQYERALQSLDRLINNPALTEPQKKVVTDVIEQMKQVIAKAGPTR